MPVSGEKWHAMLSSSNKIQGLEQLNSVSRPGATEGYRRSFVVVCGFGPSGLNVNNNYDNDNDYIGVAVARKSFEKFPARSKDSAGDGLNPAANHSSHFLNDLLNRNMLFNVYCASVFSQSD